MAERLASSPDPKGLSALAGQTNDRAVAKAVAGQFGAFLVQGMMQQLRKRLQNYSLQELMQVEVQKTSRIQRTTRCL